MRSKIIPFIVLTLALPCCSRVLAQKASLVVRVLDPSGGLLPGAAVTLLPENGCSDRPVSSALTDHSGKAELAVPSPALYQVGFHLRGFIGGQVGPVKLGPEGIHALTVKMYAEDIDRSFRIENERPIRP